MRLLVWVVWQFSQKSKLQQVSPFAFQDYNDEIRQEQLRELSYLNGSEDSARGRGIRGRGIRVPPAAPSRCGSPSYYVNSFRKCKQWESKRSSLKKKITYTSWSVNQNVFLLIICLVCVVPGSRSYSSQIAVGGIQVSNYKSEQNMKPLQGYF